MEVNCYNEVEKLREKETLLIIKNVLLLSQCFKNVLFLIQKTIWEKEIFLIFIDFSIPGNIFEKVVSYRDVNIRDIIRPYYLFQVDIVQEELITVVIRHINVFMTSLEKATFENILEKKKSVKPRNNITYYNYLLLTIKQDFAFSYQCFSNKMTRTHISYKTSANTVEYGKTA